MTYNLTEAELQTIKEFQAEFPEAILTGTCALMMYGLKLGRPASDIDFVLPELPTPLPDGWKEVKMPEGWCECYSLTRNGIEIQTIIYGGEFIGAIIDGINVANPYTILNEKKELGLTGTKKHLIDFHNIIKQILPMLSLPISGAKKEDIQSVLPSQLIPLPTTWLSKFKEGWYCDNTSLPKKERDEAWKETERVCHMIYKYQVEEKRRQGGDIQPVIKNDGTSGKPIEQVVSFLRKKLATNSRKWDRAQTTSDKIRFGGKARVCNEILHYVLNVVMNVQESDATPPATTPEPMAPKEPVIDSLRDKFFKECVSEELFHDHDPLQRIHFELTYRPDDLFEWFKPYLKPGNSEPSEK